MAFSPDGRLLATGTYNEQATVAHQLGIDDPGVLTSYRDVPVRWRDTAEIRDRYGYRDLATQPGRFAFTAAIGAGRR